MTNTRKTGEEKTLEEKTFPYLIYIACFYFFSWLPDFTLGICKLQGIYMCSNILERKIYNSEFTNLQEIVEMFFRYFRPLIGTGSLRIISKKFNGIEKINTLGHYSIIIVSGILLLLGLKFINFSNKEYNKIVDNNYSYNDNTIATGEQTLDQ